MKQSAKKGLKVVVLHTLAIDVKNILRRSTTSDFKISLDLVDLSVAIRIDILTSRTLDKFSQLCDKYGVFYSVFPSYVDYNLNLIFYFKD